MPFTLWMISCSGKKEIKIPDDVYPRDSMVLVMAEVHISEAFLMQQDYRQDQKRFKEAYMQQTLAGAGIDTAKFNRSFDFYSSNPALFTQIYDEVITEISKRQAADKPGR